MAEQVGQEACKDTVHRIEKLVHRPVHVNPAILCNKLIWKKLKNPVNSEVYEPLGPSVTLMCREDRIRTCDRWISQIKV